MNAGHSSQESWLKAIKHQMCQMKNLFFFIFFLLIMLIGYVACFCISSKRHLLFWSLWICWLLQTFIAANRHIDGLWVHVCVRTPRQQQQQLSSPQADCKTLLGVNSLPVVAALSSLMKREHLCLEKCLELSHWHPKIRVELAVIQFRLSYEEAKVGISVHQEIILDPRPHG